MATSVNVADECKNEDTDNNKYNDALTSLATDDSKPIFWFKKIILIASLGRKGICINSQLKQTQNCITFENLSVYY